MNNDETKIVLWVLDGLGGLPQNPGGPTELEAAHTPNFDALISEGTGGLHVPVAPGIIPGSGPGHLGLFGYDPLEYRVGRGVLSALGIDFDLEAGDVAARGNFCTVDGDGIITDRRAGRISTETNRRLCESLRDIELSKGQVFVETVKEHRFLLVLRGEDLSEDVADTDPHNVDAPPREATATSEKGRQTAKLVGEFIDKARQKLDDRDPANMLILRGFSKQPGWSTFDTRYGLDAACIADYPMYRGVAKLVGMDTLPIEKQLSGKTQLLDKHWDDYDFFFVHTKQTDSKGEDGDFSGKVDVIERADRHLAEFLKLDPDVFIVTGDHSTPSTMSYHSWHPVPVLLWSEYCRPDGVDEFGEHACLRGGLGGQYPAKDLMPLALAHAGRTTKYGA